MPRVLALLLPGIFVAAALSGSPAVRQSPNTDAGLAFDVASVKPNTSGARERYTRALPGGQFTAFNVPLGDLILNAYNLLGRDFLTAGRPDWITTVNYDIAAKIDSRHLDQNGMASQSDVQLMLQSVLRDRFKLTTHAERRELPIYTLVVMRSDGKLGPLLRRSAPGACAPLTMPDGIPIPPPPPGPPPGALRSRSEDPNCLSIFFGGHATARQMTLERFADGLSTTVRRLVVDRTGLDGLFDLDLDFQPEMPIDRPAGVPPPSGAGDPNSPSIFTALQEQLGLKLDATKGPVDVLVIDHVEKPTED